MAGVSPREQRANARNLDRAAKAVGSVLAAPLSEAAARRVLTRSGIRVRNRIVKSLHHSGRLRNPRNRDGTQRAVPRHLPSLPGEPPASDTGRLANSYLWEVGTDSKGLFVRIGTNVTYAPLLEFGTQRMAARPHVRPAIDAERAFIAQDIADAVAAAQRAAVSKKPRTFEL